MSGTKEILRTPSNEIDTRAAPSESQESTSEASPSPTDASIHHTRHEIEYGCVNSTYAPL